MGIYALQRYLESECKEANVSVDIGKLIAKMVEKDTDDSKKGPASSSSVKFQLIMDAECCLDRLYGGLHADWFSGGQWNRMYEFLSALNTACVKTGVKLVVFLNGALEKSRLKQWVDVQTSVKNRIQQLVKQVNTRGQPPHSALWVPPAGLRQAMRMALRHIGIPVYCSMDDHHQEVIAFCRENKFDGVLGRSAELIVFNPPRYFSSNLFKLTFKKELLTTEFLVDVLAKKLGVPLDRLPWVGSLLGNHILSEKDLSEFHKVILSGKDPQKADAKQLVQAVADFIAKQTQLEDPIAVAKIVFASASADASKFRVLLQRFKDSLQYYVNGTEKGFPKFSTPAGVASEGFASSGFDDLSVLEESGGAFASDTDKEKHSLDVAAVEGVVDSRKKVLQLTLGRHQRGLMMPWVHHVLAHKEIRLEVVIEDESDDSLPSSLDVFREARQRVYGVLLNAGEKSRDPSDDGSEIVVKEWYVTRSNMGERADHVPALSLDTPIPSVDKLWFGSQQEDKDRRLQAFLGCMNVDDTILLNVAKVPRKYLLLCTVLRCLLMYSRDRRTFLSRAEIEALLAMAVCPVKKNVRMTKEISLPEVNARGMALGSLVMQGIQVASFANDACGSPIPWQFTCPWEFFDGKLFQLKLLKASAQHSLIEICDGQSSQAAMVKQMFESITSGAKCLPLRQPYRGLMQQRQPMQPAPGGWMQGVASNVQPFNNSPSSAGNRVGLPAKRILGQAEMSGARGFSRVEGLQNEASAYVNYHSFQYGASNRFY